MSLLCCLGLGTGRICAGDNAVQGVVTQLKECRWYKVNTKPVRRDMLDGAVFPHIITFKYSVGGIAYTGRRFIPWYLRPPGPGSEVTVYYQPNRPEKYALLMDMPYRGLT